MREDYIEILKRKENVKSLLNGYFRDGIKRTIKSYDYILLDPEEIVKLSVEYRVEGIQQNFGTIIYLNLKKLNKNLSALLRIEILKNKENEQDDEE